MAQVLLIEDDIAQRMIASFALKKAGHTVTEAPDGEQGMASARAARPEVVVCDVMMPGMSGYDVVAALRADANLVNVPVILLTAMSDRKHMRQGMTAGADDYLTKPYRPDELCAAITTVLQRREQQQRAFLDSVSGMVETALEEQKESLGRQYESRLHREINARWAKSVAAGSDVRYDHAYVLLADLLGNAAGMDPADLADRLRLAQQSALDTFYLFGADHVLPYGSKLMAVFGDGKLPTPFELRALRAAVTLSKTAPKDRSLSVGLHAGPVALLAVNDSIHGDHGLAPVPGETIDLVSALEASAAANGWRVAISEPVAASLGPKATLGRRGITARGEAAVEVIGLAP